LTSIGDGVIATDCDGRVTFLNPAAEKLTGWSLAEASGRLLSEVFRIADERSGERREDPVARVLREGRAVGLTNDTNLIGRGGDVIPIDDCASPILDDAGRISGTVLVFQDISERRKAEADRERLQAQLLEAQKLESVARLAGGVAHDFNNMLTAILGHTELAMMHADLPGPVRVDLELVWNAAERSAELTRQLLAFARKQIIAPRVLDLNETVAGLLKMLLRLIGENIELVWRPSVRLWRVCADPSQIDQVLVNICVNARDAIGSVGAVTIETRNVVVDAAFRSRHPDASPAGEYALLTVSDTGCGMDDAVLGQLFEPFFTTKEIGKGTGLGLASVHGIVRQNNGFIDVESTPGAGTTFKVYWPRCGESVAEPAAAERSELPRGGGELVLLVEDESAVLQLGRTMLETLGYRVVTANSPSEALRYAGDHSAEIDLLITDVVMPQMNGRDLAQQLLRLRPGLRTLFTSGYTTDIVAEHGVLEDGARFLQKPFSLGALARAVRKILDDGLPSRSEG
jgi:PAS domain S-box-containing protein